MARRPGGTGLLVVPGARTALADYVAEFAATWNSRLYASMAADLRTNVPVTVRARTVWKALAVAGFEEERLFRHDEHTYVIEGDALSTIEED